VPDNGLMAALSNGKLSDKKIRVWDLPVRLFHWTLVVLLAVSYFSAKYGSMKIHFWSGYAILTLLIFRIAWGFVGSTTARFSNFVKGPMAGIAHLRELLGKHGPFDAGHNPVGGAMVVVLILAVLTQVAAGLFAVDSLTGMNSGPLAKLIADSTGEKIGDFHKWWVNILLLLVGLHVLAAIVYLVWKRQNLIGAMVTGTKPERDVVAPGKAAPRLVFASPKLAISLLIASAAVTYFIVRLGG
jgi:cytochrome b